MLLLFHDDHSAIELVAFDLGSSAPQRVAFELPRVRFMREFIPPVYNLRNNSRLYEPIQGPFRYVPDPQEGIIFLSAHFSKVGAHRLAELDLVISVSKILAIFKRHATPAVGSDSAPAGSPVIISWSAWGRQCARFVERPVAGEAYVHGSRLMRRFTMLGVVPDEVEVLDFNPCMRRHLDAVGSTLEQERSSDPTLVQVAYVDTPSPSSHPHLHGDVTTELPYWRVVRKGMQDWGQYGFLFNDSRIVTNLDDPHIQERLRFLDIGEDHDP